MEEVRGSIPLSSTNKPRSERLDFHCFRLVSLTVCYANMDRWLRNTPSASWTTRSLHVVPGSDVGVAMVRH